MSNYEATKYDYDGSNITGVEGIPSATIIPWSNSSIPSGLFAIVGTTYGTGDGSSTFNVPDLQDNLPIGKSGTKALGSTGGANTVQSTGNVGGSTANATLSSPQIASHSHPAAAPAGGNPSNAEMPYSGGFRNPGGTGSAGGGGGHSHNMSATFTGDATSVLQPYLTIIYIIKT